MLSYRDEEMLQKMYVLRYRMHEEYDRNGDTDEYFFLYEAFCLAEDLCVAQGLIERA